MDIENNFKEKIYQTIMDIIERGSEAVIRKRSKCGEKYIEIVEQKFTSAKKFTVTKNE